MAKIIDLPESLQKAIQMLKNTQGADAWEVFWSQSSKLKAAAKSGKIDLFSKSEDLGLSFRIQIKNRIGFSYTTSSDPAAIDQAIRKAFELCDVLPEDPHQTLPSLRSQKYVARLNNEIRLADSDLIPQMALELESLCRKADSRITQIREASIMQNLHRGCLANSEGLTLQQQDLIYYGMVTAKAEQNGQAEFDGESGFAHQLEAIDLKKIAHDAARFATEMLGSQKAPTVIGPAVLRNNVVQDLIGFLSSSFSAEEVEKGRSLLAPFKGQKVFSDEIHLFDDGTLAGGIGTSDFDGEGIASHRTSLIEGGTIQHWLTDSYHAHKMNIPLTGNASRGVKSPPSISTTNLVLRPGKSSYDELLLEMRTGVVITNLMGLHTANPVTGDFSLGASGLWIENGRVQKPIRGFAVAGNIIEILKNIRKVGSDIRNNSDTRTPSLLIETLSIAGE